MKINTEFKGNNIPYEYAAGADVSDSINGNP
ncbi:YbhB/YbcL family Raf kinase inhibitor-like protein, partial [Staphylococcus aureus]|nr:YbhB/YbcL family Raf kinase inhibitor-like protein [Staphylococcus aureus]